MTQDLKRLALVTGGAGFIGSHLCDRLHAEGWRIRILDDFSTGCRENIGFDADMVAGDIADADLCQEALEGVDTVFHLAARVSIRHSLETFVEDARTNLMGTLNVLRAAGQAGVRRFIFASSMGVYADSPDQRPIDEDHPARPLSPYGISKLAAEKYLLMMAPKMGIEPVVLRLFNTYGTRQAYTPYVGVITIFVTRILQGRPCRIYGDGNQCRDFCHVSDVVRAFVLAAHSPRAGGEIFNIGSGTGTTVNRLAQLIAGILGGGEFVHVNRDESELRYSVPIITKAQQRLGYRPQQRLSQALGEVIEALRADFQTKETRYANNPQPIRNE